MSRFGMSQNVRPIRGGNRSGNPGVRHDARELFQGGARRIHSGSGSMPDRRSEAARRSALRCSLSARRRCSRPVGISTSRSSQQRSHLLRTALNTASHSVRPNRNSGNYADSSFLKASDRSTTGWDRRLSQSTNRESKRSSPSSTRADDRFTI